jgi:hypothetical protein
MTTRSLPPQHTLQTLLDYDQHSGLITWRKSRGSVKRGTLAGCIKNEGYRYIVINKTTYLAHRLVWMYVTGVDPKNMQIDHIDGNEDNNRFANLRLVSNKQNQENRTVNKNNSSGFRGVTFHASTKKWQGRVNHKNKIIYAGIYDTPSEAFMAVEALRNSLYTHHTSRHY